VRRRAWLVAIPGLAAVVACGPTRAAAPARPGGQSLVVLLPDDETATTGRASVMNPRGSVTLGSQRDSTLVTANRPPDAVTTMSAAEVQQIFGAALSSLPAPLRHFTLYFLFDSEELTDESRAQLDEVVSAVRGRAAPDVGIVGHTDTAGTSSANFQLGLRRANAVRGLLVAAGLDPGVVDVTSHGEADPLIPTPDETPEQRNRRVEISVR